MSDRCWECGSEDASCIPCVVEPLRAEVDRLTQERDAHFEAHLETMLDGVIALAKSAAAEARVATLEAALRTAVKYAEQVLDDDPPYWLPDARAALGDDAAPTAPECEQCGETVRYDPKTKFCICMDPLAQCYPVAAAAAPQAAPTEPPECENGCGCRWLNDPDRRDCACDGPCCMDEGWDTLPDGSLRPDETWDDDEAAAPQVAPEPRTVEQYLGLDDSGPVAQVAPEPVEKS